MGVRIITAKIGTVKTMKTKTGKAFILTGIIFLAVGMLVNIRVIHGIIRTLTSDESKSISIIGGADSPTAIFISERIFMDMSIIEKAGLLLIILAPILIIIGTVILCRDVGTKKSQKSNFRCCVIEHFTLKTNH